MRVFRFALLLLFVATTGVGFAQKSAQLTNAPILPAAFGGWQRIGSSQTSNNPAVADPTNAALLKEYGFTDFEGATYARDDGRKLRIKAARFDDASGAYGAFTFYK